MVEADFVKLRPPGQHEPRELPGEVPGQSALVEKLKRRSPYPLRLLRIHVVAVGHRLDGGVTRVLVPEPSEQVVQRPLAKRAAGYAHPVDAKRFEYGEQHGNAACEHRSPPFIQAPDAAAECRASFDQQVAKPHESIQSDVLLAPPGRSHDRRHRTHRPGRADRRTPAGARAEAPNDRLELLPRLHLGPPPLACRHPAIWETAQAHAHATHVEALQIERTRTFADDQLGRPAADVDDEARLVASQASRDAEVDQARFLQTRDDLDRVAQRPLARFQETAGIAGPPHRVRADDPNRSRGQGTEAARRSGQDRQEPAPWPRA